jgi:enoyl-CoA hydratase/carnithine racemase
VNTLALEITNGIALITLSRPHVHNAINLEMADELMCALDRCRTDEQVKVLIFTGAGSSFISGGDLEQFGRARGREQAHPLLEKVGRLLTAIADFPKPTIAMINGTAVGGGCEFAASCHFRFAAERAVLGFVQIGMHITTGWGGGSRLFQLLPESKALTLLLTGERVSAAQALELGFLDRICKPEALREETLAFAAKIARQPLDSIMAYMRLLAWKRSGISLDERVRREIEQCAGMWGSREHVAAIERFLRKD